MIWTEKYRPKNFQEIKGQDEAITKIKAFLKNFEKKKKAFILYGPPGTGKTSLAYATAGEMNMEIFELNASDIRNREKLREILKPAIEQQSLIKNNKIILIDEVDGICDLEYGGLQELINIIDITSFPIIITTNDIWDKKFSALRKKAELLQIKEISYNAIKYVILEIAKKENILLNEEIISEIATNAKGDLRAAINDLQTLSKLEEYIPIILDERNKGTDIFNSLRKIFKENASNEILNIFDSVDMPLDEIMLWIEENIPTEYQGEELARAYDLLSKADLFKGRIYKQQYWRFLVYESIFLGYGISSSKKNIKTGFTSYKKPTRILKMWMNNQKTIQKKSICKKYAEQVHISYKKAMNDFLIIKQILKLNSEIRKELKLNEEEIEYIKL